MAFNGAFVASSRIKSTWPSHIWISDTEVKRIVERTVKPFIGWALIWDKNDFPDDLFKIFEQLGIGEDSWHTSPIAIPKVKIGRPKFEKAFECFKSMNFDRGSLSWKELINLIAEKTGEIPNESTYRSWVRKNKGNG